MVWKKFYFINWMFLAIFRVYPCTKFLTFSHVIVVSFTNGFCICISKAFRVIMSNKITVFRFNCFFLYGPIYNIMPPLCTSRVCNKISFKNSELYYFENVSANCCLLCGI